MAFPRVKPTRQTGVTLIELLFASLIGLITIATIGSVFLSAQKLAIQRGKQLLVSENLSIAVLQIKEDIQRAGFNQLEQSSARLSGALSVVEIGANSSLVGYVYRVNPSGAESFRNVVFKREASLNNHQGDGLKICEKYSAHPLTLSMASLSGPGGYCYQMFNPLQISVSRFTLQSESIEGESASSQMVKIVLAGHLVTDSDVAYQAEATTLVRNWQ
ncbi:pilus assembly protein PilW [Vibrio galatheae]|uniref:Pilus assembly protein PilW n=1 Tax=Vibrio galatheae TaxID=579748 RepID=A0A0F4NR25_9VIBR|nr:pilus assembly protein PilW [Vibrio galatheae]KJY85339.1 pilus assembly protein PilW [Vibrio galatheae]